MLSNQVVLSKFQSRHSDKQTTTDCYRALFYAIADANYSSSTFAPYDPSIGASASNQTANPGFLAALEGFDVWSQNYTPRADIGVNGAAPATAAWHDGDNTLATDSLTPFFVAKDFGPKYLNSQTGYQIVQPFVTAVQSAGNFTLSTITMSRVGAANATTSVYPGHAAFEVLEGQLTVLLQGETLSLNQGDVVFIPGNTSYRYYSEMYYTKVLHISQGAVGLDSTLIESGTSWNSSVWPIN